MNCLTKLFQQKRRRIGYIQAFSGPMISKRDSSVDESESASLGIAAWILMFFTSPPDASETASRRSDGYVPTQRQTRRDVETAASGRNLKVKGL